MAGEGVDNPGASRFELTVADAVAVADYRLDGDRIVLTHTGVPDALAGQGIGSRLAQGVFDHVRASGRRAVLACSFMERWVERHPEYRDLVVS